jgi:RNA polymerase sigma factor (sigma-70 family)
VARSVLIDAQRKSSRMKEDLNPDLVERAAAPQETEIRPLPETGSLPSHQKEALELRYLKGLSFEEIAGRLETSPANVRQLVSRAVRQLRTMAGGKAK